MCPRACSVMKARPQILHTYPAFGSDDDNEEVGLEPDISSIYTHMHCVLVLEI